MHLMSICSKTVTIEHPLHVNQLIEPDLMMFIHDFFLKKNIPPTPRTSLYALQLPIQNIPTAVNPLLFLQKASWPGKNLNIRFNFNKTFSCVHCITLVLFYIMQ